MKPHPLYNKPFGATRYHNIHRIVLRGMKTYASFTTSTPEAKKAGRLAEPILLRHRHGSLAISRVGCLWNPQIQARAISERETQTWRQFSTCRHHKATVKPSAIGATMGTDILLLASCNFLVLSRRIIERAGRVPLAFMLRGATYAVG